MSKRASRGRNTTIEYEYSEWDPDLRKTRERSRSMDLLDELRRKKRIHSPSQTMRARFPEHYEEHVTTIPNEAPNTTFARSFRYGKEPNKKECHDWRRKSSVETSQRGVQVDIKPAQRTMVVQCKPAQREMNIQTHRGYVDAVSVRKQTRDRGSQATTNEPAHYEELLDLIRKLKVPKGLPDDIFAQLSGTMAELLALLHGVRRTTEVVEAKEEEILTAVRGASFGSTGVPGDEILRLTSILNDIIGRLQGVAKAEDTTRLFGLLGDLNKVVITLKDDYKQMMINIRGLGSKGMEERYYLKITSYLQEILEILDVEEDIETVSGRQLYEGTCRCAIIGDATHALSRVSGALLPSLCQRCVNDNKGRTFVQSLNLPMALSSEIINTLGKAIECIERDDDFNLKLLLEDCKKLAGNQWDIKAFQVTYEALFHLALLWRSPKTAVVAADLLDVHMLVQGMKNEVHSYRLPDYILKAISTRNIEVLEALFDGMTEQEQMAVINTPIKKEKGKKLPLFQAARVGDLEIFNFFIKHGAALDIREGDRTILHELAWVSYKKKESSKLKEWNKVLVSMFGTIYDRCGHWWEKQLLHAAWTGCTEASRINALNYLFSIQNAKGLNALQFAARYATPAVIRKIVCNPPYEFVPDPLEFGRDNGMKGYVVDQIESRLARRNHSVLERMLLRDPLDGAGVMAIEPFQSMIDDKWKRYRVFYGLWFLCYLCYMFIYTWVAIERPLGRKSIADMYRTSGDYGRMVGEIFVLLCLPLFFYGEIRDAFRMGFIVPRPWLRSGMFRILNLIFVIFTITTVILRLTLNPNEDKPLALGLVLGWILALEFLGAWQSIGMFALIMHRVIAFDVALKFFMVWLIALTGTSAATYVAYQQSPDQALEDFPISNASFWYTPLSLTKVSLALMDASYATQATDPPFGVVLFIVFAILFNFVLFSLAIGMMADTYTRTRVKISTSWIWVKANYALLMDRRLPNFLCISYTVNKQTGFAALASTKLRYLTRQMKRRVREGKMVEVREHVVLVAKDDLPKSVVSVAKEDMEILASRLLKSPRD